MKCKAIHKNLIFYLEGDLPAAEMQQISSHLHKCEECSLFAGEIRKTLAVVQQEIPVEVSPWLYSRIKARMEHQEAEVKQNPGYLVWEKVIQPVMFSVLLLGGIYSGILIGRQASSGLPEPDITRNETIPYLNEMNAEPLESFLME